MSALDPWQECDAKRNRFVPPCVIPNEQCGQSCSGSLGEEVFALMSLVAGGNVSTRAHGAARTQQNGGPRPCAGRTSLPRGGTFLELGANNGFASNTRYLESCLGWTGLLIEGHPKTFHALNTTRPHSLLLASAVCAEHGYAAYSNRSGPTAGILAHMSRAHMSRWRIGAKGTLAVPCGPLGDWLELLRMHEIDFFSLDVEGAELSVLRTIDWSRLSLGIIIIECARNGCLSDSDQQVEQLLTSKGLRRSMTLRVRHDIWNAAFVNDSWTGTWGREL